jgi:long-chain acyl-CoA synthetase
VQPLDQAALQGMAIAVHALERPDDLAVVSHYGDRSFKELNANANRLVRLLSSAGLRPGDSIAVLSKNRPEFLEALFAALRYGLRFTPINFHLTGDEAGYIADNCDAKAFLVDASLKDTAIEALGCAPNVTLKLCFGGSLDGFSDYGSKLEAEDDSDITEPQLGGTMLYTSGTTGRPKGVFRKVHAPVMPSQAGTFANYEPGNDRQLLTGPCYHAAPLLIDILQPLVSGVGIVMMDRWNAEEALRLIAQHRITHSHMVATMFHRLLQLPAETRSSFDISSLKLVIHGAAPCPVHVKRDMIDWLGPVIWEYYAATEGGGGFIVGSDEWLTKPGTVGKADPMFDNVILNDDGGETSAGEIGTIYMPAPDTGRFEYYKDSKKTEGSYRGHRFTLGDMGYFDEDGYLFLTGRTAELIISGGVNIYPVEVDNVLFQHAAVSDACTVGIPNDEWGEEVRGVVQLAPDVEATDELKEELLTWVREHLAAFKCPRAIDFTDEVPRSAAGKVQRRQVRDGYL